MYQPPLRSMSHNKHCSCSSDGKTTLCKGEDLWFSSRAQRVKSVSLPPKSFCLWPLDQPWLPVRTHRNTTRLGLSGRKPARPEFCCSKDFFFLFYFTAQEGSQSLRFDSKNVDYSSFPALFLLSLTFIYLTPNFSPLFFLYC